MMDPSQKIALIMVQITDLPGFLNLPDGIEATSASVDVTGRRILIQVSGDELPVSPWRDGGCLEILRPYYDQTILSVRRFLGWKS